MVEKKARSQNFLLFVFHSSLLKIPPPDGCGTREWRVGCYVPILTRCPPNPLHRSGEGKGIISKTFSLRNIAFSELLGYNGALRL